MVPGERTLNRYRVRNFFIKYLPEAIMVSEKLKISFSKTIIVEYFETDISRRRILIIELL